MGLSVGMFVCLQKILIYIPRINTLSSLMVQPSVGLVSLKGIFQNSTSFYVYFENLMKNKTDGQLFKIGKVLKTLLGLSNRYNSLCFQT